MFAGLATPSSMGPIAMLLPAVAFSRLYEMFAASSVGHTSKLASPVTVENGMIDLRIASSTAQSACISPSTSRSGAS